MTIQEKIEMWNEFIEMKERYIVIRVDSDGEIKIINNPISLFLAPKPEWPQSTHLQIDWGDFYTSVDYINNLTLIEKLDPQLELKRIKGLTK